MYNNLTKMYMWCAGHNYEFVYYKVGGYCRVYADYNHHGKIGKYELFCVGVEL